MRQMGLAFAFAVLFLVGCSGKHSLVNPEWKNAPDSYTVLVSRPFVGNPDDVAGAGAWRRCGHRPGRHRW